MPKGTSKKPFIFDELKLGTSQLTSHIPNYKGFIPTARTFSNAYYQGKGTRTRNNLQSNMIEN